MRGVRAKRLRSAVADLGSTEVTYKRHPHTGSLHLDPMCRRAIYQELKRKTNEWERNPTS